MNSSGDYDHRGSELDYPPVTMERMSFVMLDSFNIKPNETGTGLVAGRKIALSPSLIKLLSMGAEMVSDATGSSSEKWGLLRNKPIDYDIAYPLNLSAPLPFALIASEHQGSDTDAAFGHLLVASKLDPNTRCELDMSLLAWCAQRNRAEMAGMLIVAGADPFLPHYSEDVTEKGEAIFETAYDIAVKYDARDTVKIIAAAMARQRIQDVLNNRKESGAKNGCAQ